MEKVITKLSDLLVKNTNHKKIEACEEIIIESIEEAVKDDCFYELPTNEIIKLIGESQIYDVDMLCDVISKMNEFKGDESAMLLNVIDLEEPTYESCIKILSMFNKCPICMKTGELFEENKKVPEVDYEFEINKLKKNH